jgi:hypothetical protein
VLLPSEQRSDKRTFFLGLGDKEREINKNKIKLKIRIAINLLLEDKKSDL